MKGIKKITAQILKKVFKMNNAKEYEPAPVGPKEDKYEAGIRSKEFGHLEDSMMREIDDLILG